MITISSKAGQRLAKAHAARQLAQLQYENDPCKKTFWVLNLCKEKWGEAAHDLAEELIANCHHEAEGN